MLNPAPYVFHTLSQCASSAARAAGDAEHAAQRDLFIEIFGGSHDA